MTGNRGVRIVSAPPGTGYGDAAAQYAAGLARLGAAVRWSPVEWEATDPLVRERVLTQVPAEILDPIERVLESSIAHDAFLLDVPPPRMHAHWSTSEAGRRIFTYVAWETDRLPGDWAPALAPYERVFVPSEFNRAVVAGECPLVPVDVVPHAARRVDTNLREDRPSWGSVERHDFVFYSIGTWYTRKAMEETIRAYLDAFTSEEPVALVVKTTWLDHLALAAIPAQERDGIDRRRVSTGWTLARILRDYPEPARVHLIVEPLSARRIDQLHRQGDCFVSLSRSEGFGLCPFDGLLFGNPVIATGWSGPVDYLGADYPLAVRYELEATIEGPDDDQHMRTHDSHWARADRAHASELMRRVFERREEGRAIGREMQARLRRRFAPELVCARLAELMELEIG